MYKWFLKRLWLIEFELIFFKLFYIDFRKYFVFVFKNLINKGVGFMV